MKNIEIPRRAVNGKVNSPIPDTGADTSRRQASSSIIERFFRSRLKLSQLRVLVAIADLGQLTKVADWLNVTTPAISKQVAEIENALEHPILRRVGNRVEFTEVGALLTRRAREVIDQLERTRIEVDELCSGISGKIGLGAVPTVAPLFLPSLVMNLKTRAPNTSIRLYEGHFDRLAPMLEDGTLDVVLARETGHHLSMNFHHETVVADPITMVCGTQHALATRQRIAWKELNGVSLILPLRGSSTYLLLQEVFAAHGLTFPENSVESVSLSVNAALLQSYPFIGLMPLAYVRKYQNDNPNRISVLPLSTGGMLGEIKAVWRKDNPNPIVGSMLEAIRQQALLL
jgi:DNA-binding transcriptional LysR family regulator